MVTETDLRRFFDEPNNMSCPQRLREDAARLIFQRSAGVYAESVRLFEKGEREMWDEHYFHALDIRPGFAWRCVRFFPSQRNSSPRFVACSQSGNLPFDNGNGRCGKMTATTAAAMRSRHGLRLAIRADFHRSCGPSQDGPPKGSLHPDGGQLGQLHCFCASESRPQGFCIGCFASSADTSRTNPTYRTA